MTGAILQVNGILYVTSPDNTWALDAHDGTILWHYFWRTKGGTHTGNRGVAISGDWLFFETPDDYLVSLDAKTGKERWHKVIADFTEQYFSTMSPLLIGNHLLVGTATTSTRRVSCNHSILRQVNCSGSTTPSPWKKALLAQTLGPISTRPVTAEPRCGPSALMIRIRTSTFSARVIRRRLTRPRRG